MDPSFLKRYYSNDCSDEELKIFHEWLSDPANKKQAEQWLKEMWDKTNPTRSEVAVNYEEIRQKLLFKISRSIPFSAERNSFEPADINIRPNHNHYFKYVKIAAGLVILLVFSGLLFNYFLDRENSMITVATDYGKTRQIVLSDNSIVTLNANSSMKYKENWRDDDEREVWISGEAFFEVKRVTHEKSGAKVRKKFLVHTGDLDVEVLGTTFNVSNRRGKTQVALNTGKVQLKIINDHAKEKMLMTPGEIVEFNNETKKIQKKNADVEVYSSWRHNQLIFDEMPLKDLAAKIEDFYGVRIMISDSSLANVKLTGVFPGNNLDLIIKSLPTIVEMDIQKSNKDIIIQRK